MSGPARIDHVVIAVSDWAQSNAFYADVVGAEVEKRDGGYAYRIGDQRLNVHGPRSSPDPVAADPVRPGNSDLCIEWVGPIETCVRHLEAKGVELELGPVEREGSSGQGTSVYFRDPDGSLLEFISYGPAGG
jgi:catechol 2,3-dioxygenase-like lactoylglutathione lyase family enzyme